MLKISHNFILLILAFIYLIFLFSCSNDIPPPSRGIETVNTLDERTYLQNDWKIFYGDKPEFALTDVDDSHWESIDFPQMNSSFNH